MALDHQPADIWLFHGANWQSNLIGFGSCWPSQWIRGVTPTHVGFVALVDGKPLIFESTTLVDRPCAIQRKFVKGVQAHAPEEKLESYRGKIWRMRPRSPLCGHQSEKLTAYAMKSIGEQYDTPGLLQTGTILRYARFWTPPVKSMICSRFLMLAFRAAQVVDKMVAPVEWTPSRIERDLTHDELFWPVERLK